MVQKGFRGDLQEIGAIPKQKVNEIANCFKRIDDVTPCQLKLIQKVTVGMPVTRHPPHRSRRAELPHRAPALGSDAQTP